MKSTFRSLCHATLIANVIAAFGVDAVNLAFDPTSTSVVAGLAAAGVGLFSVGTSIAAAVLVCIWMYDAAQNLRTFGHEGLTFTPGWAVGWWFVPFANLVKPMHALAEIWRASNPASIGEGPQAWRSLGPAPTLFGQWWAAWIAGNIVSNVSSKIHEPSVSGAVGLLGSAALTFAAVRLIGIMKDIDQRQDASFARVKDAQQMQLLAESAPYRAP
jgi:hypothetical protein